MKQHYILKSVDSFFGGKYSYRIGINKKQNNVNIHPSYNEEIIAN